MNTHPRGRIPPISIAGPAECRVQSADQTRLDHGAHVKPHFLPPQDARADEAWP